MALHMSAERIEEEIIDVGLVIGRIMALRTRTPDERALIERHAAPWKEILEMLKRAETL